MRKRILFVDDDPRVLFALERLLRTERARWDMVFSDGGRRALTEIRKVPFDVIVSDLRMPDMDGATLLGLIGREFPTTVRILLSGSAEDQAITCMRPTLYEVLHKPCDVKTLRDTIHRGIAANS